MSIEVVTSVLGGIVIAGASGLAGHLVGSKGKVTEGKCVERRENCDKINRVVLEGIHGELKRINERLDNLGG